MQLSRSAFRQLIHLLELSGSAVFSLPEGAVGSREACKAGAHSHIGYREFGVDEQSFSSLDTFSIDVLNIGHTVILLEDA